MIRRFFNWLFRRRYDGEHCSVCGGESAYPQCDECWDLTE